MRAVQRSGVWGAFGQGQEFRVVGLVQDDEQASQVDEIARVARLLACLSRASQPRREA